MRSLNEHMESVFDLSFVERNEFPATTIKTIGIIGGGTAGYLSALALRKAHPNLEITVIESNRIPVIGVGESSTTEIVPFLHQFLEIDPVDFFREVQPTLKLGIHFEWGEPKTGKFNFSFYTGHQYESYFYENSIANANWPSVLMEQKKIPFIKDDEGHYTSFLNIIPFSYHLENKRLVKFLNRIIQERNVKIRDLEVVSAELNTDGSISHLKTKEDVELSFDLFIDCTGFRSKLLGEVLQTEFISFDDTLINDTAITFELPHHDVLDPYTSVLTMKNGWCWKIPVREENHYGYVFSSRFCTQEQAKEEIIEKFGAIKSFKTIPFRSGRHAKAWNKNVFSLGNAYGFIEPLESTAIQILIHSVMLLCRIMPQSHEDTSSISGLNQEIGATWDTFRWFLGVHYRFNQRLDTPYWQWCRKNINLGDAQHVINLFNKRPPLSSGNFGTETGYTAFEPLVFNSYSYDTLLFGQKLIPANLEKPKMSAKEYASRVESYNELSKFALTQHELFSSGLLEEGVIEELFDDPHTWIKETSV